MKPIITLLLFCGAIQAVYAQTATTAPAVEPFGKVNQADLELKQCDFEPDANAEVLFDKGTVYYTDNLDGITMEVHRRIKIFNDNGKR
ncbi:MAG: hypothetical protein JST19_23570, partial [Bacteroidetes bacterium]|nr:hypothetical protein [Bacteroidota bacterium]